MNAIFNALSAIKGHQFVGIVMTTSVKMNKTGNPYYGRLTKRTHTSMSFNYDYENAVNNHLEKKGLERTFDGDKLPWGTWIKGFENKFISHKGEVYVRLYEISSNTPKVEYLLDGVAVSAEELSKIRPYLPTKKESAKQSAEGLNESEQVRPKAVNLLSIESITISGVTYTM